MTAEGNQTRARLLAEARDLYLQEGFDRLSLREVARRCGISAPAVYRHYDSKEALLREVCGEGLRIFSSYLLRALGGASARERLMASATQYLRFGLEHARDYRFLFMTEAEDVARLGPPPAKSGEHVPTFQFLIDRVRECMQERVLRKGNADETASLIWAYVHGLVSLRLSGHFAAAGSDAQFTRFYQQATDRFIAGLAP